MNHVDLAREVRHENPSGLVIFGKISDRDTAFWACRKKNAYHLFQTKKNAFSPCGRELHSLTRFLPMTEGIPTRVCSICLNYAEGAGLIRRRDDTVIRSYPASELEEFVF